MREAIAIVVGDEHDLRICGEAHCIADALEQCETLQPDLALIDISLKGEEGLDLVRRLKEVAPSLCTVVLSLHDEARYINGAREAGAEGYVSKGEPPQELLKCLRRVLAGHSRFPPPRQR